MTARKTATATDRFQSVHDRLTKRLGRPPTPREIADALGVTPTRVRQIVAKRVYDETGEARPDREAIQAAGYHVPSYRRCRLGDKSIKLLPPAERRVVHNLQRIYGELIKDPEAPSDADLGLAAGFSAAPDKAALEWRRYVEGLRRPSLQRLWLLAEALEVDVVELLRPEDA